MIVNRQNRPIKIALTVAAVLCLGALAFSRTFYEQAMVDGFFAFALGSVVILHLRVSPNWVDVFLTALGTAGLATASYRLLHFPHFFTAWLSFAGLSSFGVLIVRSIWTAAKRRLLLYAWIPAVLFVASDYFASTVLELTATAHPRTLDEYLMLFDASLRIQPAFIAGQLYVSFAWLHNVSLIAYVGLAVPITMVFAGKLVRDVAKALPSMLAFLVAGPIGIIFYNIFPAAGPHNLFGHKFPFQPLPYANLAHVILEPVAILGPRNAMPSLHLAWTLLAWWYSRGLSWLERSIAFVFLALTAFGTMGTGEHWFADLIVAFPFALMIEAICAYRVPFRSVRRTAFLFGLMTTLSWMALLRYCPSLFWTSAIVPWVLIAATVALTCIRQAAFHREMLNESAGPVDQDPSRVTESEKGAGELEDRVLTRA